MFVVHYFVAIISLPLQWRHNGLDDVSNYQPHHCLLSRLFGRRSKKTSKLRVTGLCAGNSPGTVNSPHKWPATREMFPFGDVIMARGFMWFIYPYYSRLCQGHGRNRNKTMKCEKARTMCMYFAKYCICKGLFSRGWDQWDPLRGPWILINWPLDLWLKFLYVKLWYWSSFWWLIS